MSWFGGAPATVVGKAAFVYTQSIEHLKVESIVLLCVCVGVACGFMSSVLQIF